MVSIRNRYLFYLLFGLTISTFSQQVRFDHFDISNKLSQNNIFSLIVDDVGYIWIGTLEGLNRFDGYQFIVYKPSPGSRKNLSGSAIVTMAKSKGGDIWVIAKNTGLNFYNSNLAIFEHFPDTLFRGFPIENTLIMAESSSGELWMTDEKGLAVFDPETLQLDTTVPGSSIETMIPVSDGRMLIGGSEGVYEVEKSGNKNGKRHFNFNLLYSEPVYQLALREDSSIVVLNEDQLLLWRDIRQHPEIKLNFTDFDLPEFSVPSIGAIAVNKNEVWLGGHFPLIKLTIDSANKAEIFRYDSENPTSFKGRTARNLVFDKNDNLWIGTSKHGLNLLEKQKNQFQQYQWKNISGESLDIDPVRCIYKTRDGNLWFGFDRYGVGVQYPNGDQKFYEHFYEKDGTVRSLSRVRSIFEDSRGNLWFGDSEELGLYNPSKDRIESAAYKFDWNWPYHCYAIKEFEPGQLVVTGTPQIGFIDLSSKHLSQLPLSNNGVQLEGIVRDIIRDQYKNYWIALNLYGVVKIDHATMAYSKIDVSNSGLTDNKIYSLLSSGDTVWIATNYGLNKFSIDGHRILRRYFEKDGLANNIIYSVYDDSRDRIWISTNNGISCFEPGSQSFNNFLESDFFMDDAHCKDHNDYLYYGGYTSVISFSPEITEPLKINLRPVLEQLYLSNVVIHPSDTIQNRVILKQALNKTDHLRLSYRQNSFSISFNAFPYNYPNNNQFRYKLENMHEEWIYALESNRLATYSGLQPGKYQFQVSASSGTGNWSAPKILNIEIVPPFWKRAWFIVTMILFIFASVFILYKRRVNEIKRRNILLKEKVDEQTSELKEQNRKILEQKSEMEAMSRIVHESDQAKLRFLTNISHEFKTPLTLILGHLENINLTASKKETKAIKNNTLRLLRLVNQLIDVRKLDQDKMGISISEFDLVKFTGEIVESFQIAAHKKNIDLRFYTTSEHLKIWLDIDKLDKILYNLISNAIKYTPKDKGVVVSVTENDTSVVLSVSDQGSGITKQDIKHIFNRFYQGQHNRMEGHGIGLSLVKSLVEIQQGTVVVSSTESQGTEFKLTFKKGKSHFKETDLEKTTRDTIEIKKEEMIQTSWKPVNPGIELLLIEDNDDLREYLSDLLSEHYNVASAENGNEAFKLLKTKTPEIIISDIIMPEMDGITFCEKLKQNASTSHIPIILLTAKSDTETKIEGFELGIDDFIEKPFNPKLLLIRINTILENREKLKQQLIHYNLNSEELKVRINSTDKKFWTGIKTAVDENFSNPDFSVEEMSNKMHMSRSSFHRKFKGLTGIGPGDYLRKFRLHKAKEMLLENNNNINEIINEVGFHSVSHFRKSFREEFGKSPSEWRKSPE